MTAARPAQSARPPAYQGPAVPDHAVPGNRPAPAHPPPVEVRGRVLVAGDRGYIGAVLVPFLRAAGHHVDGLDLGLYEGCDLGPAQEDVLGRPQDMRDVRAGQLVGYDAVL